MPKLDINGVQYNYIDRGAGDQVIFWGHGLMYNWHSFEPQIDHFVAQGYRCIAIDWRGQGETAGGGDAADYSMYRLGDDALALLQGLGVQRCHWVGLSMGGMVALRLYPRHPELFQSLVLIDTSAADAPDLLPGYTQMAETYRAVGGVPPLLEALDNVFYTPAFPQRSPDVVEYWHAYWRSADRESMYKAVMPVIDRDDVTDTIDAISAPTLIIVGEADNATPPPYSEVLNSRIKNSQLVRIPEAGHMSSVEQPAAVTAAIDSFLRGLA